MVVPLAVGVLAAALAGVAPDPVSASSEPRHLLTCEAMETPVPHVEDPKKDVNGVTYLYVGGKLRHDFSLSADFTLPRIPENRALFYADWIILIPNRGRSFVQINLIRWSKYHYRPELAYTWAGPDGLLTYADSRLFLEDRPVHKLGIAVRNASINMSLDGRNVCTGKTADFFDFRLPLYFQVGDEVNRYGDRIAGTVQNIKLKTDDDLSERPFVVKCMRRDRGLYWDYEGHNTYIGRGRLSKSLPTFFSGLTPTSSCEVPM